MILRESSIGTIVKRFLTSKLTNLSNSIRGLKEDNDLVVIRADKGNATVVMNREDYVGKMDELLKGEDYVRIRKKPHISSREKGQRRP